MGHTFSIAKEAVLVPPAIVKQRFVKPLVPNCAVTFFIQTRSPASQPES
jgi:hypothetical protein